MGVYNDMANDAGYSYGTEENQQMAGMLEWEEMEELERCYAEQEGIEEENVRREILFRNFDIVIQGPP